MNTQADPSQSSTSASTLSPAAAATAPDEGASTSTVPRPSTAASIASEIMASAPEGPSVHLDAPRWAAPAPDVRLVDARALSLAAQHAKRQDELSALEAAVGPCCLLLLICTLKGAHWNKCALTPIAVPVVSGPHTCTQARARTSQAMHVHVRIHNHHSHTHTHTPKINAHTHAHTHTHTYTHMHTHAHTRSQLFLPSPVLLMPSWLRVGVWQLS
jgi:hypothetical protein